MFLICAVQKARVYRGMIKKQQNMRMAKTKNNFGHCN